jgi:hypothetical protein
MPLQQFMLDHFANDTRERLFDKIKALEKKLKRDLFTNIRKNPDEVDFYSWITEMRFGLHFNNYCDNLKYEEKLNGQKVDWTLTLNGQSILAEARRINGMPEEELRAHIQHVQKINRLNREAGKTIDGLGYRTVILNPDFFYGSQDRVTEKEVKYRKMIAKHKIPFIICIAPIFETLIDELDTFDFLLANNKRGLFYREEFFGKYVTGVLLRTYFSEYFYFHNELAINQLNEENFKLFNRMRYNPR